MCSNIVINITPPFVFNSTHKYKKTWSPQNVWQIFILSHPSPSPIVMGGRTETMHNQITFIFSKEWHGSILSMHLTKFCKSKKWKKKIRNKGIIFQNNWSAYCIAILWICRQIKHHQLWIRNEIFISLEIILNAFNFWQHYFRLKSLFSP